MNWPQITFLVLIAMSFGLTIAQLGKPRPPYSFWGFTIPAAIELWLLYMGGFFS